MFEVLYLVCVHTCVSVCACFFIGPEYSACGGVVGGEHM